MKPIEQIEPIKPKRVAIKWKILKKLLGRVFLLLELIEELNVVVVNKQVYHILVATAEIPNVHAVDLWIPKHGIATSMAAQILTTKCFVLVTAQWTMM